MAKGSGSDGVGAGKSGREKRRWAPEAGGVSGAEQCRWGPVVAAAGVG